MPRGSFARTSMTDSSWFTSSASRKDGTMRYSSRNVSSSLLYVWLTVLCLRMYQMMLSVAVMKMIFMIVL